MKTQISRSSYRPDQRYSGVYQQQGRMLTDADWNELVDVIKARLDVALADMVGTGAPKVPKSDGSPAYQGPVVDKDQLRPGPLYAEGVRAELRSTTSSGASFNFSEQQDFPAAPPLPAATTDYVFYADIWDRVVTALEDGELRDPGLHGADTCSRTQTMAQVKWCPVTCDPLDPKRNPPRGDAAATITLRFGSILADPCDPCANEVSLRSAAGDFLFRLEVHDVSGPPEAPTALTLKWSVENGAEFHPTGSALPKEFAGTPWVYEQFNRTTECQLGVHLGAGLTPVHGTLHDALPGAFSLPWIRRWDGYGVFKRSGTGAWSLGGGRDAGLPLSTASAANSDSHVTLTAETVTLNLQRVVVTLDLKDRHFLAGDYWLACVRQNVHSPGAVVASKALPDGIVHHYAKLATVQGGKIRVPTTSESHRLAFPKLTELHAQDVAYQNQACASGLFTPAEDTVKKALDRLCSLGAESVAYSTSCRSGLFTAAESTVKKALDKICEIQAKQVWYDKPSDTSAYQGASIRTVEDALALLANLKASQVKYEWTTCSILKNAATVQQALELLCDYLERTVLDNTGRLLLFGRGVLCGLIPTLAVTSSTPEMLQTQLSVAVSQGSLIDGTGGLWPQAGPVSLDFAVKAYRRVRALREIDPRRIIGDLQVFASQPQRLETITLQPDFLVPVIKRVSDNLTAQGQNLVFNDRNDAANWAKNNDPGIRPELADKLGEILIGYTRALVRPIQVKQFLFLTVRGGSPALEVRSDPPPIADGVPGRQYHPPGDTAANPQLACEQAKEAAWAPYVEAACPRPNDGAVCLGTLGVYGDKALICPDYREQIIFTPAQAAAQKAGVYWEQRIQAQANYDGLVEKCLR